MGESSKNKEHINVARRLQDKELRWRYTKQQIEDRGDWRFLGLTKRNIGPPGSLKEEETRKWNVEVEDCLRKCVAEILLPAQTEELVKEKEKFGRLIQEKLGVIEEGQLKKEVLKGFERARVKWRKRDYGEGAQLPKVEYRVGELSPEDVGTLKRGEVYTAEENGFDYNTMIEKSRDLFRLLAHSIYGTAKLRKFIFRCIWKYISKYEEIERAAFALHWGVLCNGSCKWISSWYMLCALIKNRDLCFSEYELIIVSRLYDVNIRIYDESINNGFRCIWKSGRESYRVINILSSLDNNWSLLVGWSKQEKEKVNKYRDSFEKFSAITESRSSSNSLGSPQALSFDNGEESRDISRGNEMDRVKHISYSRIDKYREDSSIKEDRGNYSNSNCDLDKKLKEKSLSDKSEKEIRRVDSVSSMEDEIKWLFEDTEKDELEDKNSIHKSDTSIDNSYKVAMLAGSRNSREESIRCVFEDINTDIFL